MTVLGSRSFAYDSQNELVSMNGGAVQIVYDGDGNRVRKTANGVITTYLVDDLNPTGLPQVIDELTNGAVTRTYSYTYGLQRISQDLFNSSVGTWTPSFYSYDGMGSVRQLTNASGAVTDTYEYDAFGNQISHTGTTPNNYLYRGEEYDPDLGLYYLRGGWPRRSEKKVSSSTNDGCPRASPELVDEYLVHRGRGISDRTVHSELLLAGGPFKLRLGWALQKLRAES